MVIAVKAYTAGIIDGEGSIQINGRKYFSVTIQVSSNNKDVLDYLKKQWKIGYITKWRSKSKKNIYSYNWRLYATEAELLLNEILPYLIIKKENAQVALNFRKQVCNLGNKLTPKMTLKRRKLAEQMRILNKRYGKGKQNNFKNVRSL